MNKNRSVKILANDGMDPSARDILTGKGYEVITEKIPQEELISYIQTHRIDALVVRSATRVVKDLLDACPSLKLVARAGVGTDNIDVSYAASKGIAVINTPGASSRSVAELVFAHLFSVMRFLHQSNREMPTLKGHERFAELKKKYSHGREVYEKTMGIVGFGRIGQQVASIAIGLGMKVLAYDPFVKEAVISIPLHHHPALEIKIQTTELNILLQNSDVITLHVPSGKIIRAAEINQMKNNVILINTSRGGVADEHDLLHALNSGRISHLCLDVFENEPTPNPELLSHPAVSLSPHIGASTLEAQERIGKELTDKLIAFFENQYA